MEEHYARAAVMQHAVTELLAAISTADGERFRAQVTDDLKTEMPFAQPPFPTLNEGGDKIATAITGAKRLFSAFRLWATDVYPCAEKDTLIIEAKSKGDLVAGGEYANRYVFIFFFRGDLICAWKEFFDPNLLPRIDGPR